MDANVQSPVKPLPGIYDRIMAQLPSPSLNIAVSVTEHTGATGLSDSLHTVTGLICLPSGLLICNQTTGEILLLVKLNYNYYNSGYLIGWHTVGILFGYRQ